MAAPTSQHEVTARKLSDTISGLWGKIKDTFQTKLTGQTAYSAKGTATKVPQITTNALGQVTGITEVTISGVAPASHTHGNIQNGGTLQTNDITIASGDKLVVTDSSDSSKVARTSISFDGSTATKALTQKGTWETFNNYSHPTTTATDAAAVKIGKDSLGHVVIGSALAKGDVGLGSVVNTGDSATPVSGGTTKFTTGGAYTELNKKANLASPALTGTPTAPTAAAGTNTTQIATTAFVKQAVTDGLAEADAMIYKGTIAGGSTGSYGALTPAASKGWTYKVTTAGKIDGKGVEVGDMLICNTDSTAAATSSNYSTIVANWDFVQVNIDGAVVGPASVTSGRVAVFDGTTGKLIKDSGYTIAKSVPSDAVFTDTNTKVTSSANHYTPATASGSDVSASASGASAAWSIDVVKGVTLNTDGKGHVTGLSVTSGKIPANPNTDTKQRIVASTSKTYLTGVTTAPTSSNQDLTGVASTKVYATDGILTATSFSGNLTGNVTGNVTGNCSGSSGSCTGNAATATTASNISVAVGNAGEIKLVGVSSATSGNFQPKIHPNIRAYYNNDSNGHILMVGPDRGTNGAKDKANIRLAGGSGYYASLLASAFTADRAITLPDATGTIALQNGTYSGMTVGNATTASAVSTTGAGTADAARHVWFSDSSTETKRVYNDKFKYNPVGNIISSNISGTAAKATGDGSGNNIINTYATKSALSGEVSGVQNTIAGKIVSAYDGSARTKTGNDDATIEFPGADTKIALGRGESGHWKVWIKSPSMLPTAEILGSASTVTLAETSVSTNLVDINMAYNHQDTNGWQEIVHTALSTDQSRAYTIQGSVLVKFGPNTFDVRYTIQKATAASTTAYITLHGNWTAISGS